MDVIQNQKVGGVLVVLDGKYFVNCEFTDCTVLHCGGDFGWVNTQWINCRLSFDGAAARTINLLKNFGVLKEAPPDPLQQPPTNSKLEGH